MAFTFTSTVSSSITDGTLTAALIATLSETSSGSDYQIAPQSFAAGSWTLVDIGACASAHTVEMKNTDAANYIEFATANDNTGIFEKLTPGKAFLIHPNGVALYGRANTGAVICQPIIREP